MYDIFTYISHKNQPNVGKYTSPMDPMGFSPRKKNMLNEILHEFRGHLNGTFLLRGTSALDTNLHGHVEEFPL